MSDALLAWVPVLANALWAFVWQGALIGAVAAVALRTSRGSPRTRYAVATLALAACPIVFVMTLLSGASLPEAIGPISTPSLRVSVSDAASMEWTVPVWLAGVSVLLLRLLADLWQLRRLRAAGVECESWQQRTALLARAFGIAPRVELRLVAGLDSPLCFGWIKPVILLPLGLLAQLPAAQVEALIAHELAHLRRHDYLVNLMQKLVETVLFFHPVVWWLSRRMQQERELIADDLAATAISPRTLAQALAGLSTWHAQGAAPSLALAAGRGDLKARVQALLAPRRSGAPLRQSGSLTVAMQALIAVAALAVMLPLHAVVVTHATSSVPDSAREHAEDATQDARERLEDEHTRTQERMEAAMNAAVERWEALGNDFAELTESTPPDASPAVFGQAGARHAQLMRESESIQRQMQQLQQAHERDLRALERRYEALLE